MLTRLREKEEEAFKIEQDIKGRKIVLSAIDENINSLTAQRNSIQKSLETYEKDEKKKIDIHIADIKEEKLGLVRLEINKQAEALRQEAFEYHQTQIDTMNNIRKAAQEEIDQISIELEAYRAKQEAINQEILRRRELEEKTDFSRICLSNEAKSDINYLISIIPNLKNPTIIYKLIWSEYIQKQFNQMLKNVLGATDPRNVIYSIVNIKTKEVYIGKTKAEVSKRWTEHIKTSLNIGTIKSAKIHEALYNHWDDFAFSIIEKVPLEQSLSEREKFYIDFYKSNIYGYNLKNGG